MRIFRDRSRLRLPAAVAALLLVLVGAGEGVGISLCFHHAGGSEGAAGHHGPATGSPESGATHGHGTSHDAGHGAHAGGLHGNHHGAHPDPAPDPVGPASSAEGSHDHAGGASHEGDPCGELCRFLCALGGGTTPPGSSEGSSAGLNTGTPHLSVPVPDDRDIVRPTSLPHFLPFPQAPPRRP